jgi:hypothetical protein
MDEAPQTIDHLYARLLELLVEYRCNYEDELDSGGDPFAAEIMRLCAKAELMKIEEFGPLATGRLTAPAVELILGHCDEQDVIDAAFGLEAMEPMPKEKQADLLAVSERRMSMAEFNKKWLRPTTWHGDAVASLMQSEGIGLFEAITRLEQKERSHAV